MEGFVIGILLAYLTITSACLEPSATVHISNYEGPIYVTDRQIFDQPPVYDNRPPTLANLWPTCDNQSPILHTVPYSVYETDCKCVTKQSVPGNPSPSYPAGATYPQYPDGYYGYVYPEQSYYDQGYYPEGSACPKISETLIPLLKTYLTQNQQKCPKHGCQCTNQSYQYYS